MGSFVYCGLGVLLAKCNDAVEAAVAEEAEKLANNASQGAAVDTSTLSGGIVAQVDGKSALVTTTSETNPGEAFYQEVGSIHNPATHYMEQAVIASSATFPWQLAIKASNAF